MKFAKVALKDTLNISGIYSVHYFEFSKTYTFPGESHDFWEMVYVDKGRIIATAGEQDIVLQSGEVIFHKPDEWHNIRADGAVAPNVMVVSFDCRSPAMAALISRKQKISTSQREILGELLSEAQLAFSSPLGDPYDSTLVRRKNSIMGCEQLVKVHLLRFLLSLICIVNQLNDKVNIGVIEDIICIIGKLCCDTAVLIQITHADTLNLYILRANTLQHIIQSATYRTEAKKADV